MDVYNVRSNGRVKQIGVRRTSLGFILDQMEGKRLHVTMEWTGRKIHDMLKNYQEGGAIGMFRIIGIYERLLGCKHVTV